MCRGEAVAVKIMSLQRDTAEDIKREIKLMRDCDCGNIVSYRDAFVKEHEMRRMLWVVMELCEMGSALDVMKRQKGPLDETSIAWICKGVLAALDYMHSIRKVYPSVRRSVRTRVRRKCA